MQYDIVIKQFPNVVCNQLDR